MAPVAPDQQPASAPSIPSRQMTTGRELPLVSPNHPAYLSASEIPLCQRRRLAMLAFRWSFFKRRKGAHKGCWMQMMDGAAAFTIILLHRHIGDFGANRGLYLYSCTASSSNCSFACCCGSCGTLPGLPVNLQDAYAFLADMRASVHCNTVCTEGASSPLQLFDCSSLMAAYRKHMSQALYSYADHQPWSCCPADTSAREISEGPSESSCCCQVCSVTC